jgi:hypothetical protein
VIVGSNGDTHFAILPGSLEQGLVGDFKSWLIQALAVPSRASTVVLEYLQLGGPSVDVRGFRQANESEASFWVQMSLSGCAGEAEVSADVAAHWAACWHRARWDHIRDVHLIPFGFTPDPPQSTAAVDPPFLPAGELGYLELTPPESREKRRLPMFLLDHSVTESLAEPSSLERIEERFAPYMTEQRCRCQLCEPGLGDVR